MCGKFTALASWREVVEFSQALTGDGDGGRDEGGDSGGDEVVTYRVGAVVPVIVRDAVTGKRRIVPMRWSWPDPMGDWRRPKNIHARAETIDTRQLFRDAWRKGQLGIIVFRTFNEGEEVPTKSGGTKTKQWTVDPRDGRPRGIAVLWEAFEIPELPEPLMAFVMITVPASELVRRVIKPRETDPRQPAILEDDAWGPTLGEVPATSDERKALLKTMEGVTWEAFPEPQSPRPRRR